MRTRRSMQATSGELQRHITATYFSLRAGMGVIALLFPVVLLGGGSLLLDLPLQGSISAYYHTGMRNWFVGVLFAIGSFLYLYKGYGDQENVALNAAGLLAVAIAAFPTRLVGDVHDTISRLHGIAAVLFFLCIAYVAIFRASDTLPLVSDGDVAARYDRTYRILGVAMALSPLLAALIALFDPPGDRESEARYILFLEVLAIWTFAAFWLVKSREIRRTHADQRVVDCEVERDDRGNVIPEGADCSRERSGV